MKIQDLRPYIVSLPFRFSFKHSLAKRSCSHNIIVKATIEDDHGNLHIGYGEGIPREYVTGENIDQAAAIINSVYSPHLIGQYFANSSELISFLKTQIQNLALQNHPVGSFWCALETALLDAASKADGVSITHLLARQSKDSIKYGAVIPFGNKAALIGMLIFFRLCGFSTVKIKVGQSLNKDLECLRLARLIVGKDATLRVDANCAWTVAQTIAFANLARPYKLASIEQPLPAEQVDGIIELASHLPEAIVLDESLCTVEQAKFFAAQKMANKKLNIEFNLRLSKLGGLISTAAIAEIAQSAHIQCHLGAQVGESGILTAAARAFAISKGPFLNHEGAANALLLQHDLVNENLTFSYGGLGKWTEKQNGLGITIKEHMLMPMAEENKMPALSISIAKHASL